MKIHLIIEIDGNGKVQMVDLVAKVAAVDGKGELLINPADALDIIKRKPGRPAKAKIAEIAPEPIPALPEPTPPTGVKLKPNSGPQFDPGFLKIIQEAPEPFTRRSIAVSSGLNPVDVTQRFIRLAKKGWIEQPARELWKRTKTFGIK